MYYPDILKFLPYPDRDISTPQSSQVWQNKYSTSIENFLCYINSNLGWKVDRYHQYREW